MPQMNKGGKGPLLEKAASPMNLTTGRSACTFSPEFFTKPLG